ncbi:MAG: metallophosphoesterase [Clostridia bacterium]
MGLKTDEMYEAEANARKIFEKDSFNRDVLKGSPLSQIYIDRQKIDAPDSIKPFFFDFSRYNNVFTMFLSDLHIGSRNFEFTKFIRQLNEALKIPNLLLIINGDALNSAIQGSVSNVYKDYANPSEQARIFMEVIKPFVKKRQVKIIGTSGNHEERINQVVGIDTVRNCFAGLGIEEYYAPNIYVVTVRVKCPQEKDGYKDLTIVGYHGTGMGGSASSSATQTLQLMRIVPVVDILAAGHTHKSIRTDSTIIVKDPVTGKDMFQNVTALLINSYQGYGGYAARQAMPPSCTDNFILDVSAGANLDYEQRKSGIILPQTKFFISSYNFGQLIPNVFDDRISRLQEELNDINEKRVQLLDKKVAGTLATLSKNNNLALKKAILEIEKKI